MDAIILLFLVLSFYLLGKAADFVVTNVKIISEKLGIQFFFLGIILGFLTSLPELFLGMNSMASGIQEVSLGNLLGGIIVLFGPVLGISIFYNRKIENNGKIVDFAMAFVYMLFPFFMGLDGKIGPIDAFILIATYLYILYIFYIDQKKHNHFEICITSEGGGIFRRILMILFGIVAVIIMSNVIIRLFLAILEGVNLSIFTIGLIMFSIGTNLPELAVSVSSHKKKAGDLSLSNIIGSAVANIAIIGMFALIKPFEVKVDTSYYALIFFTILIFALFLRFYKSDFKLTRQEGLVLIFVYLAFVIVQINYLFIPIP